MSSRVPLGGILPLELFLKPLQVDLKVDSRFVMLLVQLVYQPAELVPHLNVPLGLVAELAAQLGQLFLEQPDHLVYGRTLVLLLYFHIV